jgi:hypothetical protein
LEPLWISLEWFLEIEALFKDIMLVNGYTWPCLNLERRCSRFLNGCNLRFLGLDMTCLPRTDNGSSDTPAGTF